MIKIKINFQIQNPIPSSIFIYSIYSKYIIIIFEINSSIVSKKIYSYLGIFITPSLSRIGPYANDLVSKFY